MAGDYSITSEDRVHGLFAIILTVVIVVLMYYLLIVWELSPLSAIFFIGAFTFITTYVLMKILVRK